MELIKMEMTPKERAAAYARGEEVDRHPISLGTNETISPTIGVSMLDYYFNADTMVQVESYLAETFQADNMGIGLGLRTLIEALGTEISYKANNVSSIQTPVLKKAGDCVGRDIVNVEKDGRLPIIIEAFEKLQIKYGKVRNLGSGLSGPLTVAAGLLGTVKDKENLHKLMQYSTDNVVECCRQMNQKLGIKFMLSEPIASKDLISKKQFDEFFLPYLKQAVERMNEFQGATGIHICGHTRDRWEDVVNAGVASFWVDNCESLQELKECYGDRISMSGNVPPVDILRNGTPEDVEEAVRKCLLAAADNPRGYTISAGCTVPTGTPIENMIAYVNAAAKWGRGARKGQLPKGILDSL